MALAPGGLLQKANVSGPMGQPVSQAPTTASNAPNMNEQHWRMYSGAARNIQGGKSYEDYLKDFGNLTSGLSGMDALRGPRKAFSKEDFEKERNKAIGGSLRKEASDFQGQMGQLAGQQSAMLKDNITKSLDEGLDQTRKNYSARGLLYSGLRQGAEGNQRAQAASQYSQGVKGINNELRDQLNARKDLAASWGLQNYSQALQNSKELSNVQMQNAIARRQAASQLGQGLGYAAGYGMQNGWFGGGGGSVASGPAGSGGGFAMGPDQLVSAF